MRSEISGTYSLSIRSLLANRVPNATSTFTDTWRDYTITNLCACFGPLIACVLCEVRWLGRRYTMSIGAIVTAVFFFGYTVIRTSAQNLALSSSICKSTTASRTCLIRLLTPWPPPQLSVSTFTTARSTRTPPRFFLRPSDDGQRHRRGVQPHHGPVVGCHRAGRRHDHDHSALHLRGHVHHHGHRLGCFAV